MPLASLAVEEVWRRKIKKGGKMWEILTAPHSRNGRDVYARALGTHYAIFAQLEDSLNRHSENETFQETRHVLDALRSTAAFERDLKVRWPNVS
jgi:hypothetical protein